MPLPCNVCRLKADGCNNCNEFNTQCQRFTPLWSNQKHIAISDSCGLRIIPPAYVPNPLLQVMVEIAIEEMNNG
jgi:hypothetical protein